MNSTSVYSPGKYKLGPSPLSRPESCSSASSAQDWDHNNQRTVMRRQNNLSKLSPGVTDSSSSLSTLGLGLRKYLVTAPGQDSEKHQHVPVRSVFTEAGYYSNKAKLMESSSVNDKLSIRAEVSKPTPSARKKEGLAARLEPGVTTRVPPTGGSYSPDTPSDTMTGGPSLTSKTEAGVMMRTENMAKDSIKEHIISTQMRKINRELPISEVYHERSLGLGLAPPLSKLIMSNNIAVAQVDHHPDPGQEEPAMDSMSNFDNLSVIEAAQPARRQPLKTNKRPPVPPKPMGADLQWLASAGAGLIKTELRMQSQPPASRDDGDGRSMTDSQYSGCSPSATQGSSKDLSSRFSYAMKMRDPKQSDLNTIQTYSNVSQNIYSVPDDSEEAAPESPAATAVINTNIHPSDIAQYINTEFHSKKDSTRTSHNTLHPQVWTKDKHGRFTYNGSLASDC